MAIATVTDSSFGADVLQSDLPVLVDFSAEWCGPCKALAPLLEEIATEMNARVKIVKLDVDHNTQIATQFGIRSVPTLILFNAGKVVSQMAGARPKGDIIKWINSSI